MIRIPQFNYAEKKINMDIYQDTTIKSLFENGLISTRTYNCLSSLHFKTIEDIQSYSDNPLDLLNERNFGKKALVEVTSVLSRVIDKVNPFNVELNPDGHFSFNSCIDMAFDNIKRLNNKLSNRIQAKFESGQELHKTLVNDYSYILNIEPDFNQEENQSIREVYLNFISDVIAGLKDHSLENEGIYPVYKRLHTEIALRINDFSDFEIAHFFMPPALRSYIQDFYQKMYNKHLSTRAVHFVEKRIPSFDNLILYFDKTLNEFRAMCPGSSYKKTLTEIHSFTQFFKKEYFRLCDLNQEELENRLIKDQYPFLLYKQRRFVLEFIAQNGHAPLFFIFHEALRISENRTDKIFCLVNGLFDNKKRSLDEVADAFDLVPERIRQISREPTTIKKNIALYENDLKYYKDFFDLPFICEDNSLYIKLREQEHLTFSFEIFASIIAQVSDYQLIRVNDHTIAISEKSSLSGPVSKECIDKIEALINSKFAQDTEIPIKRIAGNKSKDADFMSFIIFLLKRVYNLPVENGKILFTQNYINVSNELYDILKENGEPMTVSDIFYKFKEKYPEHSYTEPSQIKVYLYRNEHIRSIGRQSLYALTSWKNVYFGSIRDLMYEIMNDSDEPVHIGEIFEKVTEYYPDTNIKSIASSIQSDTCDRFISFEDGYFGIKGKNYSEEFSKRRINQRTSFEDRMRHFRNFVDAYHRFPLSNGGEEEASLRRWYYNVENCVVEAPSEEALDEFLAMIEDYNQKGYPRTGYEYEFLANCEKYQEFINSNYTLPTMKNGTDLYYWLKRSMENYDSYVDHRRLYLKNLIYYIQSLGFSI